MSLKDALAMAGRNEICDAKTLIALYLAVLQTHEIGR